MGAQQTKSGDEQETIVGDEQQQQYDGHERIPRDGQKCMNETRKETVMSEENLISATTNTKRITVANFAKIKEEPQAVEEYSAEEPATLEEGRESELGANRCSEANEQNNNPSEVETELISLEHQNLRLEHDRQESLPGIYEILPPAAAENNNDLQLVSDLCLDVANIDVKKELLETCGVTSDSGNDKDPLDTSETSIISLPTDEESVESTNQISIAIKSEKIDDIVLESNLKAENIVLPLKRENSNDNSSMVIDQQHEETPILVLTDEESDEITSGIRTAIKSEKIGDIVLDSNLEEENIVLAIKKENSNDIWETANDTPILVLTDEETDEINNGICTTIKTENDKGEAAIDQQHEESPKLLKNPFFKRSCNKRQRLKQELINERNQDEFVNKTIKSELTRSTEDLNTATITRKSTISPEIASKAITIIHDETLQTSINLKELIIKSETLNAPDGSLDFSANNNLNINCLSCNLNSSLDVNLSNPGSDFAEALSTQSIEEVKSSISRNSSLDSLKYFTVIDLTTGEKEDLAVKDSPTTIITTPQTQETPKAKKRRPRKPRRTKNLENSKSGKIQIPKKRGRKPHGKTLKSKKYSQKDYSFVSFKSNKSILKNLPKISIKTREKINNKSSDDKITSKTSEAKNDFPKPFKSEPHKEQSIATVLPKPIMFKNEKDVNIKDKSYLKPEFQPYVRLKRLKSEDLLVPLKIKPARKTRKRYQQMSSDNRRDFLIQHAFSLNQRAKLNRLSIDHDHAYYNNQQDQQPSLYSRLTTPLSMPMDTTNESVAETDSKYFSPQELYSLFHTTSTPDASSMFSGHLDSGVSTSTPSLQPQRLTTDYNKTLLLEIAAERAFINNHLMHFGYSPIQFDLFNNLSDLNIFLKYLFGNANMN